MLPAVDAIFALIVMVFAIWTTNINNLYSASLSIARIVPRREPEASKPGQPLAPMTPTAMPQPDEITVTGRELDSFDNPVREQEV